MKIVKACIVSIFLTITLHWAIADEVGASIEAGSILGYSVYVGEPFELPAELPSGAYSEVPVWVITNGSDSRYFLSTDFSCVAHKNPGTSILKDADAFSGQTATLTSISDIRASEYGDPSVLDPDIIWRRNYHGIYSAQYLESGFDGKSGYLAIFHGENKNEGFESRNRYYDNMILPSQSYTIPDEYSGLFNGVYKDYWPTYFAIISAAWSPSDENEGNNFMSHDLGPILWPSGGYVTESGEKAGNGLRAPISLVHDGYIYVFYNDQGGIKVSRAPVSGHGAPGTFMNYYRGSFSIPSLPAGFTKENARDFLDVPGGKSTYIHEDLTMRTTRFSVAKLEGTKYFVSVEGRFYYDDQGKSIFQDYLRLSEDLVNWSDAVALPGTISQNGKGVNNPILANSDYTSNTLLSPGHFYVIGSGWADGVMKGVRIRLEVKSAHWPLNGALNDPNFVEDITGNGFDGTGTAPLIFVPGKIGNALEISSEEYISVNQVIDRPEQFTIASWVKTATSGALLSFRDSVNKTYSCFEIEQGNDGTAGALRYAQWDGSTWQGVTTLKTVNNDQWHHVAMTYDEGQVTLYIDGLMQDSTLLTNNNESASADELLIASNRWAEYQFAGLLDDIQFYNYPMTNTEIAALYLEVEDYVCMGGLQYDLNGDCFVDLEDLSMMITQWLDCTRYGDSSCPGVVLP